MDWFREAMGIVELRGLEKLKATFERSFAQKCGLGQLIEVYHLPL
jgi:hypothetical protein